MIVLSDQIIETICKEGEACYPDECCGILFGTLAEGQVKYAESIEPIANSSDTEERYHRFLITPETMLRAERKARKHQMDIVGFYHSHPDQAAVPSQYDREHALPVYSYLIVSVAEGKAAEIKSWELIRYDDSYFKEEMIAKIGKEQELWQQY